MELKLEVVLSSSIKRKKPWPRFCWLGKEKESVFLLDDKRISEINMVSGRTKKKTPKLHPLLNSVVTMASSRDGMWLCGLLVSGELFLWNRDKDLLKTAAAVPEVIHMMTDVQGNATRLTLQVSGDGMRMLLAAVTGQVFLWECLDVRELTGGRDGTVKGCWAHIRPLEDSILPSSQDKEASQQTILVKTEAMGDACLSAFVFTTGKKLIVTLLKIQWEEIRVKLGSVGYGVQWATKTYPLSRLSPPCQPVKSRGALVPAFSPDGRLLAIVLNQRQPKATQVLFVSTQNFVSISSGLGGCGSKKLEIPSKYVRSYWVGGVSWSPGGLFLACVLKRGSLLMVSRLGGLLTLTSTGCSVDFGPAQFLPLHPLVTYRPPMTAGTGEASLSSSSLSARDVLRQRYSVTWHPRLLYLIVSDGYMATVLRVLDGPSPALLLTALLKDTARDLERAGRKLEKSQMHVRAWLESVSCLNLDSSLGEVTPGVTHEGRTAESVVSAATDRSTLPLFLQDQGTPAGTKELLERVQTFFEDDSDLDVAPAGSHREDGGRLEFASMFDTLHAASDMHTHTDTGRVASPDYGLQDSVGSLQKPSRVLRELGKIQTKLLTAWAFGLSLGNAVEGRARLPKQTLRCALRFAALLHLIPKKKNTSACGRLTGLLKALLTFLPWDGVHWDCLGPMVEFTRRLTRLVLTPRPESHRVGNFELSSESLSAALLILRLVSDALDSTYSLQQRNVWSSAAGNQSHTLENWPSDVHHVPSLQLEKEEESSVIRQAQPVPQRPSSRMLGVWRWVYEITQQYMEELRRFQGCDGWQEEQQQLSVIMSQIQTALQATGDKLEEGPALLSHPGEHLFLCGSYPKSADTWRLQICEENNKSGDRSVFKETQLCLALLYSLLSQYELREAQELGDHMARLILHRAGHNRDHLTPFTDSLPCQWMPLNLHGEAACAVVQALGRFMASYFTNQPLHVAPPHHVTALPPLHLPHAPNSGRLVALAQQEVSRAVRRQQLSEVWTVDYAQDLLLIGGLLPEAAWLAYHLGDWKTAASLSLAYTKYCADRIDFSRLRKKELHLPRDLEPESIFQGELESLLGNESDSKEDPDTSFTDPLEGEDWDSLQVSLQEILKASVMAGVDVISSPLSSLLDTAKELCSGLPALVPNGLYLPSPPLYCPQPSPNTQDAVGATGQLAEVASRHKVSRVLQRLLLLLSSARCCHPAAQWYMSRLRRARHVLQKIKRTYSYASAAEAERDFPEGLMKFLSRGGFFRRGPKKDGRLDADTVQTITCFRELCALCWMLHVRDRLSISCRKYQAARRRHTDQLTGSEVTSSCADALRWACRLLPFSCFLNAEEILQDLLLSLASELPPLALVADMLVRAFPEEEESVRVPLREKFNSLLQRLRQCKVIEGEQREAGESMTTLIRDKRRLRRKHLGRLRRHVGAAELHLWQKAEDVGAGDGGGGRQQLSPGTTLSSTTGTLTDLPAVYSSDRDTADNNTSEAASPEMLSGDTNRGKKAKKVKHTKHAKKSSVNMEGEAKRNEQQTPLPVVGSWEFELDDDHEYLIFLELFLSYVLEKDASAGDAGDGLPLLKGFSSQLRDRELHSLAFDVLTTIHRRQKDSRKQQQLGCDPPPVFRAGCCYKPAKQGTAEIQTPSVRSEAQTPPRSGLSVSSLPGLKPGHEKGLFGLRRQSNEQKMKAGLFGSKTSPVPSAFPIAQQLEKSLFSSSTSVETVLELQQGLDPTLEAQFPDLGRLLEWMVRWAAKRVLLGHRGKKKKKNEEAGPAGDGVVIRVKASAPAVLTSLSLLQGRYAALLTGTDRYIEHIQVARTQWTVAPVMQPEVERKVEEESSVDTGYPGSANTPITGLDPNLQQGELSISSPPDEPRRPVQSDQDPLSFVAQHRQTSPHPPSLDDLDVTPEKEGKKSDAESLAESSSVSDGNISENICTPQTSLRLADLEIPDKTEDSSCSISLHSYVESPPAPPRPAPQALPTLEPTAGIHAELPRTHGAPLPNTAVGPPSHHPQDSTTEPAAPNPHPASTQAGPTRQRLGEDLFRLVQHINHLSLMEVIGASFSNLQTAQQSASLAQSGMNGFQPDVPLSRAADVAPQPNALPVQTTFPVAPSSSSANPVFSQGPVSMFPDVSAIQSSGRTPWTGGQHHITAHPPPTSNGAGLNYQEMQPLSLQATSPDIQFRESRGLIPPSQGLLATTDPSHSSHSSHSVPVLPSSNDGTQNEPAPQFLGLKLLHLQRPPLPQHGSQHAHYNVNPATAQNNRQDRRNVVPRRQLNFNPSREPTPGFSHSHVQTSERLILPPAHTHAPMQGLPLLHLDPVPHSGLTFPKLPTPSSSSRPAFAFTAPMGQAPMIKLLHLDSGPKTTWPRAAPSAPIPRLMSVEELVGRQNAENARLRLLSVDPPSESAARPVASPSSDSNMKRQKRREKTRHTEVTFRPEESIIPTQEPVNEEPSAAEEVPTRQNAASQYGSVDSLLTGQRLLDRAMSTSADLHAFASTCKRAPECHDAFTNTEPAFPPALVNKAVSVSASSPRSQSSGENKFFNHTKEHPQEAERSRDVNGRQFISVLDLEEEAMHLDLGPRVDSPGEKNVRPPSPTSAELHVLATSVLGSSAAAADPLPSVPIPQAILKPATHTDIPEAWPSVSRIEPTGDPDGVAPGDLLGPSAPEVLRAVKSVGAMKSAPSASASASPAGWFSSRLSQMDAQLASLQNIADSLEVDFSNSRMLVNTIERLQPAVSAKTPATQRKTVRLSVPRQARVPQMDTSPGLTFRKEENENREEDSYSHSQSAGPSRLHTPPRMDDRLTAISEISSVWTDENLGQTELSDTAELLDQLVKEGYLSLDNLDLSNSRTESYTSRLEQQQQQRESSWMSQRRVSPVDERRELRIWMRRKQRENQAVYLKQRESLKEKERKPFSPSAAAKSSKQKRETVWKSREEKEKFMLLEQYNQRTLEACSLAGDFLTSRPARLHSSWTEDSAVPLSGRPVSAPLPADNHSSYSLMADDEGGVKSGAARPDVRPWTAETQGSPSEEHRRRLGLHRPVTSLPRDRLSQVTRRGMLTNTKSNTATSERTVSQSKERPAGHQRGTGGTPKRSPWRPPSAGSGEVKHWGRISELQGPEESHSNQVLSGPLRDEGEEDDDDDAGARASASVSALDWLDRLSDTASSDLSRVDWSAIEIMVAAESLHCLD